jgi:hypothetical protein
MSEPNTSYSEIKRKELRQHFAIQALVALLPRLEYNEAVPEAIAAADLLIAKLNEG